MDFLVIFMGKGEAFANIVYLFVPYFSRANASPLHKIKREWEEAYQKPEISHSTFTAVAFRNIYKYCQVIWGGNVAKTVSICG
jgi:hypothetical protein